MSRFFLLFVIFILIKGAAAHAGVVIVNNGGDTRSMAFAHLGDEIAAYLQANDTKLPVSPARFQQAVSLTWVQSTDEKLQLDGVPKDAINTHPEGSLNGKILFNRQAWDIIGLPARAQLVAHEYLGIIDVDDSNYAISAQMAALPLNVVEGDLALQIKQIAEGAFSPIPNDDRKTVGPFTISCSQSLEVTSFAIVSDCEIDFAGRADQPGQFFYGETAGQVFNMLIEILPYDPSCLPAHCTVIGGPFICTSDSKGTETASCNYRK